jgi:hypothetical protein
VSNDPLKITFVPPFRQREDGSGPNFPPEPAVKHVPEWYRSLARFDKSNDDITLNPENNIGTDGAQVSTKMCMPYFDALTAGYNYCLEDDLYVDMDETGHPILSWNGEVMLVDTRPIFDVPLPDNCHPIHYGWRMNWFYETPPGYSVLITHPMNRHDLPFYTLSGIVESDIWGLPVFTAFFLKRNFRGVIPKGTPIFQIIPFKRESWELDVDGSQSAIDEHWFRAENRRSMLYGYYKKTAWRKKFFGIFGKREKEVSHDDE